MTALLITALSVGLPSLSWTVVRCRASAVTQRITQQALEGCPATQRANVLRASAELANELGADRVTRKPIAFTFRRQSDRSDAHFCNAGYNHTTRGGPL
jgi:hypothetical protein